MTTQALNVTILSAPVAAVDRRALSQAWYSALHLAGRETVHDDLPHRERPSSPAASDAAASNGRKPADAAAGAVRAVTAKAATHGNGPAVEERRAARSSLAGKIERVLLSPRRTARRSSLIIDSSKARVAVTLQETSRGVRLVAMCAPHSRAVVARALEEARYALASRAIVLLHALSGGAGDR